MKAYLGLPEYGIDCCRNQAITLIEKWMPSRPGIVRSISRLVGNWNVYCGASGFATRAVFAAPPPSGFRPYVSLMGLCLAWTAKPCPHTRKLDYYARPFATFALCLHPIDGD